MAVSTASMTINDYDGQAGIFGLNLIPLTAANYAAEEAKLAALYATLDNILEGIVVSRNTNIPTVYLPSNQKSDVETAQRGNKWIVSTYDSQALLAAGVPNPYYFKPFSVELPTAKLSLRTSHSNIVWVIDGAANDPDMDAFVTAYEDVAKSPVGGTLKVVQVEAVSRSGG